MRTTRNKVLAFLDKNPRSLCNAIARVLKTTPALLTPVLQLMREDTLVKSTGRTRGTKWSLA